MPSLSVLPAPDRPGDDGRTEWFRRLIQVAMASEGALTLADLWSRPLDEVSEILTAFGYVLDERARDIEKLKRSKPSAW